MTAAKEQKKKEKKQEKEAHLEKAPIKVVKKKGEVQLTNLDRIELVKARINKSYEGKGAIVSGDEMSNVFLLRRPTGIADLDVAIGGGWPAGGLSQIIGKDNSGKTYLANRSISEVQKIYQEKSAIAVCMTEQKYDKAFAKWKCDVALMMSKLEIDMIEQSRFENGLAPLDQTMKQWLRFQIGHFQEAIFQTAEQLLEAACQMVEENVFQIVLIDSFGALQTAAEAEAEGGLEDKQYGGASGVVTKFMHRLHAALNLPDRYGRPNTTTVLGINQYRANLKASGPYANPLNIAGGYALKHGKLVDVLLEGGSKLKQGKYPNELILGKEINWTILKGKAGCHDGGKGDYRFYYGEHGYGFGVDIHHNLLLCGVQQGVVQQTGAWYSFDGQAICQGQDGAAAAFMNNPAMAVAVKRAIYAKIGLSIITKESF